MNKNEQEFSKLNLNINNGCYSINLQFNDLGSAFDRAQHSLDAQVWADTQKYMPLRSGMLKSQTNALNQAVIGSGKVYMYPPSSDYGHYQYEGIVYVDPVYKCGGFLIPKVGWRSRKGVEKVPSTRHIKYTQPNATAHWGETAIKNHKQEWVEVVRKAINRSKI